MKKNDYKKLTSEELKLKIDNVEKELIVLRKIQEKYSKLQLSKKEKKFFDLLSKYTIKSLTVFSPEDENDLNNMEAEIVDAINDQKLNVEYIKDDLDGLKSNFQPDIENLKASLTADIDYQKQDLAAEVKVLKIMTKQHKEFHKIKKDVLKRLKQNSQKG